MLITVGSVKGSPGASTFAALLARMWPSDGEAGSVRTLLEADADGSTLAAGWHETLSTAWSPGFVEFASAARGNASMVAALAGSSQPVGGDVVLIPGIPKRSTMENAIASLSDSGLAELARHTGLVVADVGRYRTTTLGLVRRSQLALIVCRPTLADAQLLGPVVAELSNAGGRVGLVTVGDEPHSSAEIAETVGVDSELAWSVMFDARAARIVSEQGPSGKVMLRSKLGRRVRSIANEVALLTGSTAGAPIERGSRMVKDEIDPETKVATSSFGEVVGRG